VNRRKNGRASEAVAASAPTKTCSNVPIARRDVRRYHHQAGLRTHECIWSMPANRLPASLGRSGNRIRCTLVYRCGGSAGFGSRGTRTGFPFHSPPFSFRTKRAAKHLTTSAMMLTVAKAISKLRTYPTYYAPEG
jgi:hypothetical protein